MKCHLWAQLFTLDSLVGVVGPLARHNPLSARDDGHFPADDCWKRAIVGFASDTFRVASVFGTVTSKSEGPDGTWLQLR